MTAIPRGPVAVFLLRAGSVAGLLAIIAGIFAMHVITGNHTMHSHAAAQAAVAEAVPAAEALSGGPASCACSAECPSLQKVSGACVPSAKTGTLTAPEPPHGTLAFNKLPFLHFGPSLSLAYVPATPSPGDLSISRT